LIPILRNEAFTGTVKQAGLFHFAIAALHRPAPKSESLIGTVYGDGVFPLHAAMPESEAPEEGRQTT